MNNKRATVYSDAFSRILSQDKKFDLRALDCTADYSYKTCKELLRLANHLYSSNITEVDAPYEIEHAGWVSDCYWFDVLYRVLKCSSATIWVRKRPDGPTLKDDIKEAEQQLELLADTRTALTKVEKKGDDGKKTTTKWPKKFKQLIETQLDRSYYFVRVNVLVFHAQKHKEGFALLTIASILERKYLNEGMPNRQMEKAVLRATILYLHETGSPHIRRLASLMKLYGSIQEPEMARIHTYLHKLITLYTEENRQPLADDEEITTMHDFLEWVVTIDKVQQHATASFVR